MFTFERSCKGNFINNPHPSLTNNSCFDLQQYVETKLKTKYNLTSTTIYFEVINLNESFTIDLDEQDIKNIFSQFGPVKHVEIVENIISITFNHYFSVIFSFETISDLIDKEKKVYLKPKFTKEEPTFNKELISGGNTNFPYFQQPTFVPFYNNNGYLISPGIHYNTSFDTPIYHNHFIQNNCFPSEKEHNLEAKIQSKNNNIPKKTINYTANSNIFTKRNIENDMKFQTDTFSKNLSLTNFNSKNLSMNSPVFYPQNFYSPLNFTNVTNNFEFTSPDLIFEEENNKFICIYDIQIENDDKFKVTKRVIGLKGNNMKKILNTCKLRFNYINCSDLIKIRLRGKGSGYKEGLTNKESEEPLQLCVSSKYNEVFVFTCGCIENLLNKIYLDYHNYSLNNKLESKKPKEIKKQEYKINKNHF